MNKISIIVPIYNAERYLSKCIKSVINQTHKNIELILINDGSIDSSKQICDWYTNKDNRIKLYSIENSGVSNARNIGIKKATGKFMMFLDADDYLGNRTLELLVDGYIKTKADLIIGNHFNIIKNKIIPNTYSYFNSNVLMNKNKIIEYVKDYLTAPNKHPLFSQLWGNLFKSSIVKSNNLNFDKNMTIHEDLKFNFEFLFNANSVFFITDKIYYHLIHDDNMSLGMYGSKKAISMFPHSEAFQSVEKYIANTNLQVDKLIGQAYITYTIIQLIRVCSSQIFDRDDIYETVKKIVYSYEVKKYIKYYRRNPNDSVIIPALLRLKFIGLLIYFCKMRGVKRYDTKT